jgi:hypothetical protein
MPEALEPIVFGLVGALGYAAGQWLYRRRQGAT